MKKPHAKIILIFSVAFTFLAGCREEPCLLPHLAPAFIGFSQTDLDTIVVRAYEANGAFNHLLDTLVITGNNGRVGPPKGDTTVIETNYEGNDSGVHYQLSPGYDWEIYMPILKKGVFITQIKFDQTHEEQCIFCDLKNVCRAPMTSYNQNGQLIPAHLAQFGPYTNTCNGDCAPYSGYDFTGYLVYIHK